MYQLLMYLHTLSPPEYHSRVGTPNSLDEIMYGIQSCPFTPKLLRHLEGECSCKLTEAISCKGHKLSAVFPAITRQLPNRALTART